MTRQHATCRARDLHDDKRPSSWGDPAFRGGVEFDALISSVRRDVPEFSRRDCTDAKVNFYCGHGRYFSPVDLTIGQDRRKRGLGAFKNTIEPHSLFDQGMVKYGVLVLKWSRPMKSGPAHSVRPTGQSCFATSARRLLMSIR